MNLDSLIETLEKLRKENACGEATVRLMLEFDGEQREADLTDIAVATRYFAGRDLHTRAIVLIHEDE